MNGLWKFLLLCGNSQVHIHKYILKLQPFYRVAKKTSQYRLCPEMRQQNQHCQPNRIEQISQRAPEPVHEQANLRKWQTETTNKSAPYKSPELSKVREFCNNLVGTRALPCNKLTSSQTVFSYFLWIYNPAWPINLRIWIMAAWKLDLVQMENTYVPVENFYTSVQGRPRVKFLGLPKISKNTKLKN